MNTANEKLLRPEKSETEAAFLCQVHLVFIL